jgi:hypothetical protein
MKKYRKFTLLLIFLLQLFFSTNCSKTNSVTGNSDFPDIGIPIKNINSYLKIKHEKEYSISKDKPPFCVLVTAENISNSVITIEPDTDVKIFQKINSDWKSIQNNLNYNHRKWPIPIKGGDAPNIWPIDMCPELYDISKPTIFRVIITGVPENIYGVKKIISSTDITITP